MRRASIVRRECVVERVVVVLMFLSSAALAQGQEDLRTITHAQEPKAEEWRPEVPRVWDDAAIKTIELPLATAEYTPRHVSSEYYYKIPPRDIYKSYHVYHPDREPSGYWEWLHEQEPEIVFDPSKLTTKEDWIRAGELVFMQGDGYTTGSELDFVRDRAGYVAADVRLTKEGRFPYARYVVRKKGKVELETNSCAGCHTRVMDDGSLLLGGPGNNPLGEILAYEIRQEIASLPQGAKPQFVDKMSIDYRFAAAPWLEPDPGNYAIGMSLEELARVLEALPPGVFVRQRTSYENPVRVPDLIGVADRRFLDATGISQQRSMADLMRYAALNQEIDELASYGGFRPSAEDFKTLPDPSTLTRNTDEQLYALALFLESLSPPPNPNPFGVAARRGQAVFQSLGCNRCHTPPLYSNNRLVPAPGFVPPPDHRKLFAPMRKRVGTDVGLTLSTRRGTGYYKVPSLRGVWYRGPFFHDGSLATLEDVFDSRRLNKDYVPTGFRGAGVDRRSVPGHEFGLDLTEKERTDLIAFLRTI